MQLKSQALGRSRFWRQQTLWALTGLQPEIGKFSETLF